MNEVRKIANPTMDKVEVARLVKFGRLVEADLAKAAKYEALADGLHDREMADGYRALAAALRSKYPNLKRS